MVRRVQRLSSFPTDLRRSVAEAIQLKDQLERELIEAVERAERDRRPTGPEITFRMLCEAYRDHHSELGKRLDRDQYRIDALEGWIGSERDPASITRADWDLVRGRILERGSKVATVQRYQNTLLAILNSAVKDGLIPSHNLHSVRKERVSLPGQPKTLNEAQREVLLGAALDEYERRQEAEREAVESEVGRGGEHTSMMPLRGLVYVAYFTLMRPTNNFSLRWEELQIDLRGRKGSFRLNDHKNARKGIIAAGALAPRLVEYLIVRMPSPKPSGLVHANPETMTAYKNIRKQWKKLIGIANEMLPAENQINGLNFYNLRHSGASDLVARGADPVMVTKLMGDSSLATVERHYFATSADRMRAVMESMGQSNSGQVGASPKTASSSVGPQVSPGEGDQPVSVN